MGGTSSRLGGGVQRPGPTAATALATSTKNDALVANLELTVQNNKAIL